MNQFLQGPEIDADTAEQRPLYSLYLKSIYPSLHTTSKPPLSTHYLSTTTQIFPYHRREGKMSLLALYAPNFQPITKCTFTLHHLTLINLQLVSLYQTTKFLTSMLLPSEQHPMYQPTLKNNVLNAHSTLF
jgi:hypothetical protein